MSCLRAAFYIFGGSLDIVDKHKRRGVSNMGEKVVCEVCQKYSEESDEMPGWCFVCVDKYGHLNNDKSFRVIKIKRKRDDYA